MRHVAARCRTVRAGTNIQKNVDIILSIRHQRKYDIFQYNYSISQKMICRFPIEILLCPQLCMRKLFLRVGRLRGRGSTGVRQLLRKAASDNILSGVTAYKAGIQGCSMSTNKEYNRVRRQLAHVIRNFLPSFFLVLGLKKDR